MVASFIRKLRSALGISLVILCAAEGSSLAQGDQVCQDMAKGAAHDIEIRTSANDYYSALFNNYCNSDGSTSNNGVSLGATFPINGLPVNLTGNSTDAQTRMSTFCKTFSSTTHSQSQEAIFGSKVVEKTLLSVNDCLRIVRQSGNSISHDIQGSYTLFINIVVGGGSSIEIHGLSRPSGVGCKGPGKNGKDLYFDISTTQQITATMHSYTITCTRPAIPASGGNTFYADAAISLSTNAGEYNVYWPSETGIALQTATQIQTELKRLASQVADLSLLLSTDTSKLDQIEKNGTSVLQGTISKNPYGNGDVRERNELRCPDHQYLSGVKIEWSGTCKGQCDADGGIPHAFIPICKALF